MMSILEVDDLAGRFAKIQGPGRARKATTLAMAQVPKLQMLVPIAANYY